jgi:uncharacterized protein YuzE
MAGGDGVLRPSGNKEAEQMRVHFDEQADAVYVRLDETPIVESEEVQPGVILDFDKSRQVIGVEILGVKKRVSLDSLKEVHVRIA